MTVPSRSSMIVVMVCVFIARRPENPQNRDGFANSIYHRSIAMVGEFLDLPAIACVAMRRLSKFPRVVLELLEGLRAQRSVSADIP